MAYQFQPASRVVADGDSITADFLGQGHWYDPALATINAAYLRAGVAFVNATATATSAAGTVSSRAHDATQDFRPVLINTSLSGAKMADRLAAVGTVIAANPTDVWLEVGVGDAVAHWPSTAFVAQFQADATSYWAAIKAALPTCRLVALSIYCYQETTPSSTDTVVNAYNAAIQAAILGAGGVYIDQHAVQQAWEIANNTPSPGVASGLLTADGIHPLHDTGVPMMSSTFLAGTVFNGAPT